MSEQMRSDFEEWYQGEMMRDSFLNYSMRMDWIKSHRRGASYGPRIPHGDALYRAWQASRAALCVELPKEVAAGRWADDTGYFKDDVIEAIHAAGVKTK